MPRPGSATSDPSTVHKTVGPPRSSVMYNASLVPLGPYMKRPSGADDTSRAALVPWPPPATTIDRNARTPPYNKPAIAPRIARLTPEPAFIHNHIATCPAR